MPVTLIIDTSIRGAAVGLLKRGGKDLAFAEVSEDIKDSARQLPLMVKRGLESLGATCRDVEGLVISQGPGSFTGIRVGLAYAYGFGLALADSAAAHHFKVLGASSLLVLAESFAKYDQHDVVVFLPATKTSGYAANLVSVECCQLTLLQLVSLMDFQRAGWCWVSGLNWRRRLNCWGAASKC